MILQQPQLFVKLISPWQSQPGTPKDSVMHSGNLHGSSGSLAIPRQHRDMHMSLIGWLDFLQTCLEKHKAFVLKESVDIHLGTIHTASHCAEGQETSSVSVACPVVN